MQELARTGRTTRMLREAIRLDAEGRMVYVVVPRGAAEGFRSRLRQIAGDSRGIERIRIETEQTIRIDWNTMRIVGAHPVCVVLVDHSVIENRFGGVLEMLHRFDAFDQEPPDGAPIEDVVQAMATKELRRQSASDAPGFMDAMRWGDGQGGIQRPKR